MQRKKKILIVMHSMHIGGAERALLGMMAAFDFNRYDVDLFLLEHAGELMKYIPGNINILPEIKRYTCFTRPLLQTIRLKEFKMAYVKLRTRVETMISKRKTSDGKVADATIYAQRAALPYLPPINPEIEYDLAISYRTPHYLVVDKVKAKRTMAWIHTDYSKVTIDQPVEEHMWKRFDFIASISEKCTESFISIFPNLISKIVLFDHVMQPELIRAMADEFVPSDIQKFKDEIAICSIGRFVPAKNFTCVPHICRDLLNAGFNVKWYLIGYGAEENAIRECIENCNLTDNVIILGKKDNPYPYIKMCDIYAQPSIFEGRSVAVIEAQILNKPVVISNFPTAQSQLQDGVNGVILPLETKLFAKEFIKLLKDPNRLRHIANNASKNNVQNADQMKIIDHIIEGVANDY